MLVSIRKSVTLRLCDICESTAEYRHMLNPEFIQKRYGGDMPERGYKCDLCLNCAAENFQSAEGGTIENAIEEIEYHGPTYV